MSRLLTMPVWFFRRARAAALALAMGCLAPALRAQEATNAAPVHVGPVITNIASFWIATTDAENRSRAQRLRMEVLVYFCDTNWAVAFGQSDGLDTFLPFRGIPQALKSGQRVLMDGWALPVNQEILWDRTTITVLSENIPIETVRAQDRLNDADALNGRFVEADLLVDTCQSAPGTVLKLNLVTNNFSLTAFVHTDDLAPNWPDISGQFVRVRGVYVGGPESAGRREIVLWIPGLDHVQFLGTLAQDPCFALPLASSDQFDTLDPNALVRVAGTVRRQQSGEMVTIWDKMGQIHVLVQQQQPVRVGDQIEAIGYPRIQGLDRILSQGVFRMAGTNLVEVGSRDPNRVVPLADAVRGLDQDLLALHPRARITGIVTFVDNTNSMFVEDASGGIRVMKTRLQSGRPASSGMLVTVEGVAAAGEFAPIITNAVVRQTGSMALPEAPLISLEQALTGTEDGRWVQMRGFVRRLIGSGDSLEAELVAPGGEFVAHIPAGSADEAPPGSVVSISGVCAAVSNARRQLTGVEIYSPLIRYVQTEQSAPVDPFALPQRRLSSLRQFNWFNSLNQRIATEGTVILQSPGRHVFLQDGDSGLFALSSQTNLLTPGDQVEIVGFPGNDGGRFLLREAVFRRLEVRPQPIPVSLTNIQAADENLDGLLARARGVLVQIVTNSSETRFVMQSGGKIFEAKLDQIAALNEAGLLPGSTLAVTGVYRLQLDEYGKPVGFLLLLRNPGDVQVLAPPPWWTLRRLFFLLAGSSMVFLVAVFWALQNQRKNRQLERATTDLTAAHARLEERVLERTRELNEESERRKRALVRLSEAQQRLIQASRQAGMAEVATGILHNVGNILNSVNISASVIDNSVQSLRIGNFSKAAELLAGHADDLASFLSADPRGRALPEYLQQLAASMGSQEQKLRGEVQSLIKQIDHVKSVIAWQQDHARGSGFYENLKPADLMEDALQISQASYERHGIEVVREYDDFPEINADRNKIFQILVNLLGNAKQALMEAARRQVVLRIRRGDGDQIRFEVSDSGVGIPPQNLERVFSMGFTTKADGHGFGLHSGANNAHEMGGRLYAVSEGSGRGATFVLELPVAPKSERPAAAPRPPAAPAAPPPAAAPSAA